MKKLLLTILIVFVFVNAYSQYNTNQNKVWAFGFHAGLDFNSGTPVSINTAYGIDTIFGVPEQEAPEGCAQVSDANGNLLFYTNGRIVYNRAGYIMPHGDSIVPFNTFSTTQGAVIAPVLNNATQYYIFSLQECTGFPPYSGRLAYTIVDMTLNGGYGDIMPFSTVILPDSLFGEKMILVAGNNCDLWLIAHKMDTASFYAYRITSSGISLPVISAIGTFSGTYCYGAGVIKATPNRQKIVCQATYNGTELYDFDPNTGIISNCNVLSSLGLYGGDYGAEFSPDNTKLYVAETNFSLSVYNNLYQYDISLPDTTAIIGSKTLIAHISDYDPYDLKLGPDNKIYFPNNLSIGCIPYPNNSGTSCGYISYAINITPNYAEYGLSNVFVNIPSAIIGPPALCPGDTTLFTDSVVGGTWSSSNTSVAVIDSATGILSAISTGVSYISYTDGGCVAVTTFSVIAAPPAIAGNLDLCTDYTTSLIDAATSGTWSSGNTGIATVGSVTGIVTGVSTGTDIITYSLGAGCTIFTTVNVIPSLPPITGDSVICTGGIAIFSDSISGGYWFGSYRFNYTGYTSGVVNATYAVVDTITYNLGGCTISSVLTINPSPTISYPGTACVDYIFTLSATPAGGSWSTPDSNATIDSSVMIITSVGTGIVPIFYTSTVNSCTSVVTLNVIAGVPPIIGPNNLCVGSTVMLSDSVASGTWSGNATGAFESGAYNGYITGVFSGIDTITYNPNVACNSVTTIITVDPLPDAISGINNVCVGDTLYLSDSSVGGKWSIGNDTIATIDSITGAVVGVSSGTVMFTYTIPGGCYVYAIGTVLSCPNKVPIISNVNELSVYPNPTTTTLTITAKDGIKTVVISNLLGQTVYSHYYNAQQVQVDVADLLTGVYLVKVNGTEVWKFVKE